MILTVSQTTHLTSLPTQALLKMPPRPPSPWTSRMIPRDIYLELPSKDSPPILPTVSHNAALPAKRTQKRLLRTTTHDWLRVDHRILSSTSNDFHANTLYAKLRQWMTRSKLHMHRHGHCPVPFPALRPRRKMLKQDQAHTVRALGQKGHEPPCSTSRRGPIRDRRAVTILPRVPCPIERPVIESHGHIMQKGGQPCHLAPVQHCLQEVVLRDMGVATPRYQVCRWPLHRQAAPISDQRCLRQAIARNGKKGARRSA